MREFGVKTSYPNRSDLFFAVINKETADRFVHGINKDSTPATAKVVSRLVGEWEEENG